MMFFLPLAFTTMSLLLALCTSAAQNMAVRAPTPLNCGNSSNAVPLYSMELPGADYFYSALNSDIDIVGRGDGYNFNSVVYLVFTTQESSTVPLFHVYNTNTIDNLYTTSTTERDLALESGYLAGSTTAYIYPSQICGSVPFYRLYSITATAHYYTINGTERGALLAAGGWEDEGITGYVLDFSPCA
ncbi:hypothetical protein MVEN_00627900 [Mycena venus]|uniref:DUF5648 domain-containing protein n=1 Tax=Mycena venus TaxID=2733690 RepID=A0A8H6YQ32_9AGAR|nr:hypothetical protein MVEN_00627900 [Mycena venus]